MTFIDFLVTISIYVGYVGTLTLAGSYFPMLKKAWNMEVRGMSVSFLVIQFITAFLWAIYGLGFVLGGNLNGLPLVIANIWIMCSTIYVIQVVYRCQKAHSPSKTIKVVVEDNSKP